MIRDHFGVSNLPDSFIFLPEQLGGLALRNPFVGLFLVRNKITQTPEDLINEFLETERQSYLAAKKWFESCGEQTQRRRLLNIYPDQDLSEVSAISESERSTFFSLEEFSRFRERDSPNFLSTFEKLVSVPETAEIALSKGVETGLIDFLSDSVRLNSENKWFLQLYSKELLDDFGGLSLVDKQFLPVGVLTMMRGKKVSWNMIL